MRKLRLLFGTAKIDTNIIKKVGDIVEFENDAAAAQMVSGAWEDVTDSVNSIEASPDVDPNVVEPPKAPVVTETTKPKK